MLLSAECLYTISTVGAVMLLNLSDVSNQPLYQQIISQIRIQVVSGALNAKQQLLSIREFASKFQISVITVQKAYEELGRDGIIFSRRGKGYFISELSKTERQKIIIDRLKENIQPILKEAVISGIPLKTLRATIKEIVSSLEV